jgi:catechol 2,3-dioxygenase
VAAIEASGYRTHGWVEGDAGHGRAYRFEDPFGHVFELYWDTRCYEPPPEPTAPRSRTWPAAFTGSGACPRGSTT